jgi:hypothetical protein
VLLKDEDFSSLFQQPHWCKYLPVLFELRGVLICEFFRLCELLLARIEHLNLSHIFLINFEAIVIRINFCE